MHKKIVSFLVFLLVLFACITYMKPISIISASFALVLIVKFIISGGRIAEYTPPPELDSVEFEQEYPQAA